MKKRILYLSILSIIFLTGCNKTADNPTNNEQKSIETKAEEIKILAIGQSNMANSGTGLNYVSSNDVQRIDNLYNLVLAQSPVTSNPLATGTGSSFLPVLGDMLVESDKYSKVTYANVAVNSACVIEWTPQYPASHFYKIKNLAGQGFNFTHILYHQGECDVTGWSNTTKENYKNSFLTMLNGIRELGITAPIYLARVSYVHGKIDSNIIQAQNELIQENTDILEGPNTDNMGSEYRYDNLHFNSAGLTEHARMWNQSIQ